MDQIKCPDPIRSNPLASFSNFCSANCFGWKRSKNETFNSIPIPIQLVNFSLFFTGRFLHWAEWNRRRC